MPRENVNISQTKILYLTLKRHNIHHLSKLIIFYFSLGNGGEDTTVASDHLT